MTALRCGYFFLLFCQFYTGARLQFNKGIIITVFGEVMEGFLRAKYTAHYFNLTVFQEEMLQELISFTIK